MAEKSNWLSGTKIAEYVSAFAQERLGAFTKWFDDALGAAKTLHLDKLTALVSAATGVAAVTATGGEHAVAEATPTDPSALGSQAEGAAKSGDSVTFAPGIDGENIGAEAQVTKTPSPSSAEITEALSPTDHMEIAPVNASLTMPDAGMELPSATQSTVAQVKVTPLNADMEITARPVDIAMTAHANTVTYTPPSPEALSELSPSAGGPQPIEMQVAEANTPEPAPAMVAEAKPEANLDVITIGGAGAGLAMATGALAMANNDNHGVIINQNKEQGLANMYENLVRACGLEPGRGFANEHMSEALVLDTERCAPRIVTAQVQEVTAGRTA